MHKVLKANVENCLPFRPILLALSTPTYKRSKFLVPILKHLTTNEFSIKYCFHFAEEIVDQQSYFFMGSLDQDFPFTNMALEETIEIGTNEFFKVSETIEGIGKSEFKDLLSLATKDLHFVFDGTFCKQIDGVAVSFPIVPTLANAFLVYHEKNWPESSPLEYRPFYCRSYVDDIFVLFNSPCKIVSELLKFSSCQHTLYYRKCKRNRMSFPDINIIHEQGKCTSCQPETNF